MLSLYSLVCVGPGRKPKLLVFSRIGSCNCVGLYHTALRDVGSALIASHLPLFDCFLLSNPSVNDESESSR